MHAAFQTWHGVIVAGLTALVPIMAAVEFLGGAALKSTLSDRVHLWWYNVSKIPIPKLGQSEAEFALCQLRKYFGWDLFSGLRILSSLAFVLAIILSVWLFGRIAIGPDGKRDWHLAFSAGFYLQGMCILTMCSVGTSQWIISLALQKDWNSWLAPIWFLATLAASLLFPALLGVVIAAVVVNLFLGGPGGILVGLGELAKLGIHPSLHDVAQRYVASRGANPEELLTVLNASGLLFLRLALALGFMIWWALGWSLKFIDLTLRRVAESDKGPLTILSAIVAGLANGFEYIFG